MISDFLFGYGYFLVCWVFFILFMFLLCYGIVVLFDYIYLFVFVISDIGVRIFEVNIFLEFFNFFLVLMVFSLFVCYFQFQMLMKGLDLEDCCFDCFNKLGLGFGLVSVFGGLIIVNFLLNEVCLVLLFFCESLLLFLFFINKKYF